MSVQNGAYTRTQGFMPEKNDGIVPRFYIESIHDPLASQQQGRAIFFDQERVELLIPGNTLNIKVDVVSDEHRGRWPEHYKRFKDGQQMSANGTPLEQWPILRPAQVNELKAMNLFTVEHVRDMSDHVTQRMMGGVRLRQLAEAYLDDAAAQALLTRATADNDRKDMQIAELNQKVTELSSLLNGLHGELQGLKNAPHPLATHVPGMHDPAEQMKQGQHVEVARSSLENLPDAPRRRRQPMIAEPATS